MNSPPLPALHDVSLVAVTSVALQPTLEALRASMRQANFGEVLLLSDRPPAGLSEGIIWHPIERLNSRGDYSRFMLGRLCEYIRTSHALCIQWDGFVLNGSAWAPEFMDYDYIGAVWPQFPDLQNVGNGGFSLRSRRLLRACSHLPFDGSQAEDVFICRISRKRLEGAGMRFAPVEVARRFSFERTPPTGHEFGFHGAFNLAPLLSPNEADRLFRSLEPELLARSERFELLQWALRRGRPKLALTMLKRLI